MLETIPLETITLDIGTLPNTLAGVVGYLGMILGFYLIFICERSDVPLILFGAGVAALGTFVYATVRLPSWLPDIFTLHILVTTSLILILALVVHLTWLTWQYYGLKSPLVRVPEYVREIVTGAER